jgi:hypothetical protein
MRPEKRVWGPPRWLPAEIDTEDAERWLLVLGGAAGVPAHVYNVDGATVRVTVRDWIKFRTWLRRHRKQAIAILHTRIDEPLPEEVRFGNLLNEFVDLLVGIGRTWDEFLDPDNPRQVEILIDR